MLRQMWPSLAEGQGGRPTLDCPPIKCNVKPSPTKKIPGEYWRKIGRMGWAGAR